MSEPAAAHPLFVGPERTGATGAGQISVVWSLGGAGRDLDAAVVRLAPGADLGEPAEHGCGLLLTVLAGSGELRVPGQLLPLTPGALAWLPARTPHSLRAGQHGLTYTTTHRRPLPQTGQETAGGAGEPACLLERVCPQCGRLAGEHDARYCARCGTALPGPG
ncbi:cupin domain-containing protein [Streptomyces sp. NPDC050732]|uniref:cupin domain-containing protein n=1 Tax=Streptomyces sp. NPDC050732 TaxID=3154632 RepID=UPI00341E8654